MKGSSRAQNSTLGEKQSKKREQKAICLEGLSRALTAAVSILPAPRAHPHPPPSTCPPLCSGVPGPAEPVPGASSGWRSQAGVCREACSCWRCHSASLFWKNDASVQTLFFFFGMGKSFGPAMTDVLAHPSSAAGCSVPFLAPSTVCPKGTTLQIPPVTLPKLSEFFIPDAEHPCASSPLLGSCCWDTPWLLLLLNPRGRGGIEGSVPPANPALGWKDPPMHGDNLGHRNSCWNRIQLVMRWGLLCPILAAPAFTSELGAFSQARYKSS